MKKHNLKPFEERRKVYKETHKRKVCEQRAAFQKAKREGLMKSRNLAFLAEILNDLNLSQTAFAHALGITQQAIYHHFMCDDIKLSMAQRGLAYYGYELLVRLQPSANKTKNMKTEKPSYMIEGIVQSYGVVRLPAYILERAALGGRVAFLACAIVASGRSFGSLCADAEVDPSSMRLAMVQDDIRIMHLYAMARVLGATIVWSIRPSDI